MDDELSAQDFRDRYKARLLTERAQIMAAAQDTAADRKPVTLDQQSVGRLSRMDALQGQALAKAIQTRREGKLQAIDAALERLATDDFGWCEDCGVSIGVRRLDLDPTLGRCVACAS